MSYTTIQQLPTRNSTDQVWIAWYKDLRSTLGAKKANTLFSQNWSAQNANDSDANTTYLREELSKYGIDIGGGFFGNALDTSRAFAGGVGDIFSAYKIVYIGLMVVVVGSIGVVVYQFATNEKFRSGAIKAGATIATKGKV